VGVRVAAHPATAMKIHDCGQRIGCAAWPNDPHGQGTAGANRQHVVLDIRAWPADGRRLELGQGSPRLIGGQILDWRFVRSCVDEKLCPWVNEGRTPGIL
jgi:hypothetical protein